MKTNAEENLPQTMRAVDQAPQPIIKTLTGLNGKQYTIRAEQDGFEGVSWSICEGADGTNFLPSSSERGRQLMQELFPHLRVDTAGPLEKVVPEMAQDVYRRSLDLLEGIEKEVTAQAEKFQKAITEAMANGATDDEVVQRFQIN